MNLETLELEIVALFGEAATLGTTAEGEIVVYTGLQDELWEAGE